MRLDQIEGLERNIKKILHSTSESNEKIEELRKDINWNDDRTNDRITNIDKYTTKKINELVEENKQLKTCLVRLTEVVEGILDNLAKFSSKEKSNE